MSNLSLYLKMAADGIKKNKTMYFPYVLSCSFTLALFYILTSVEQIIRIEEVRGAERMSSILSVCALLYRIIAVILLFYVNSFLLKRRKKEFGLYRILGMEKRHIRMMLLFEVLIIGIISVCFSIISGAFLSQLMFLLLLKIARIPSSLTFRIPFDAVLSTCYLAAFGFCLVLLYDFFSVSKTSPARLLQQSREGEREPKSHRILAVLSLLLLALGYGTALYISSPDAAFLLFLPAVLFVILGTYGVLLVGSIALLKFLRKKESFFYRPSNFIAVSGMIYRMKQNAVGLATICILSTAVLVTVSTCTSLFFGEETILRQRFPRDVHISSYFVEESKDVDFLSEIAQEYAEMAGIKIENEAGFQRLQLTCIEEGNGRFSLSSWAESTEGQQWITCITKDNYESILGEEISLSEQEALFYTEDPIAWDTIAIDKWSFSLTRTEIPEEWKNILSSPYHGERLLLILPNQEVFYQLYDRLNEVRKADGFTDPYRYEICHYYDLTDLSSEQMEEFYNLYSLREFYLNDCEHLATVDTLQAAREDFYQTYGSVFFAGLFFVAVFSIATVLIIYYKQITEGYEDKERFSIMQRVGMSDRETKKAIQQQIVIVFFLPLGMSFLHTLVAFPALCQVLTLFKLQDFHLFGICTLVTAVLFGMVYLIVYLLTAKTYYRIVKR